MSTATHAATPSTLGPPPRTKVRNPLLVFALVIPTLGIYYLVWYYTINRELRDLGRATGLQERLGRHPLTSLLAVTLGWLLVVPPFVSIYGTFRRIAVAQEVRGVPERANPWVGLGLFGAGLLLLPVEMIYARNELNRVWRASGVQPAAPT